MDKPQKYALRLKGSDLYFQKWEKGGHKWVPLENALVLPRKKWMVSSLEELVPVKVVPVILEETSSPEIPDNSDREGA